MYTFFQCSQRMYRIYFNKENKSDCVLYTERNEGAPTTHRGTTGVGETVRELFHTMIDRILGKSLSSRKKTQYPEEYVPPNDGAITSPYHVPPLEGEEWDISDIYRKIRGMKKQNV